ncbi:hypothetical protein CLAFUW4_13760 [Fulvia fulva]|nr:hypothetical protein CLAFUR4_13763 [Fulvia fulva]KAK4610797.1 hypothetical protein CLAFUR0_13767 [Fulvia fulva]WPV22061.1 hypothetical protein CLAFUW4_13760 [Fulvia fulva]WPV36831.1 hypothetical protein CLAFUW7_13768 [Fulvia fulva]
MAITSSTPTITATVRASSNPLPEYQHDATTDTDTTTTRYVQSNAGDTFEIHADIASGTEFIGDCLAFCISINGVLADTAISFPSGQDHAGSIVVSKGCYTAGNTVKKYQFTELEKRDGGAVPTKEEVEAALQIGTIRIDVHHQLSKSAVNDQLDLSSGLKSVDAVDEKALKGQAISSTTSYTEAVANDGLHARYWDAEFVDPDMKPMAVFVFRYTSHEDLQAMGMIAPDPTPEPEEEPEPEPEPDLETMTAEELKAEVQRRRQAERDATVRIKREREDDDQQSKQDKRFRTTITLDDDGEETEVVTTMLPVPEVETIA